MKILAAVLLTLAGRAGAACVEPLPAFEQVAMRDHYVDWSGAAMFYGRQYHCAQDRIVHAWRPSPDGSASAEIVHGDTSVPLRVPKVFVDKTITHIEAILAGGHARYLFVFDFDHGHMHMKKSIFEARHGRLWSESRWAELYESVLADPDLETVYHSQELLRLKTPPREFIGRYLDSPVVAGLDTLPPEQRRKLTEDTHGFFKVYFKAHPLGAYRLSDGTRFDFSLEGDSWETAFSPLGVIVEDHYDVGGQ
jgi:hypothetical protein